jgi:hypothetical protein
MTKTLIKALLLIITALPLTALSQITIKGRIINQADTKPVENASVFISNATIGDKTGKDGTYTLTNIKAGKYELVVSIIGFDIYKQTLIVENNNITLPDITIYPKSIGLNEIKIKPNADPDRQRNFDWFKDEFLGKTALAKECRIVNPELLDLNYDERNGILTARSIDFLIIENKALGYRIKYLLTDFMLNNYDEKDKTFSYAGSVLFEKMKGTADEEEQWKTKRQEVYEGSQMHFLRSVLNNQIEQNGFRVLRLAIIRNPLRPSDSLINEQIRIYTSLKDDKGKHEFKDSLARWTKKLRLPQILQQKLLQVPLTKDDIVKHTGQRGLYALEAGGNDALFITYNKYHYFRTGAISHLSDADNTSGTLVSFNTRAALFDNNGSVTTPLSLSYDGIWIRNRLAGLLPVDYEPIISNTAEADSGLLVKITDKVNSYSAKHLTEKTYLHFDKPYYIARDTMYFKAYVTDATQHKLSNQSSILYADLVDPQNNITKSVQILLKDGVGWGDFALPDTLKQGNYRVRAYTSMMLNESGTAFFEQSIIVGAEKNIGIPGADTKHSEASKPEMDFLPEGGSIITGVRSKVAFKCINSDGLGFDVKGTIINKENKEVVSFASSHLGMGYFYLTPADGETYRAKVIYADGKQELIELPISNKGVSIEVSDLARSYTVKITSSKSYYRENKNKKLTLIIYAGGTPMAITSKLNNTEIKLTVLKNNLRTGITTATLFTEEGEPLCERLMFVQNDDLVKLNVSGDKEIYKQREKVKISIQALNKLDVAIAGHLSMSVIDESKVKTDENNEPTIINNLLLTSDLRGYIEQPNYYFLNPNDKTIADLDLVMLTHGFRKMEWKEILNDKNKDRAKTYQPESGLQIAGMLSIKGKPVVNGKVKLFSKSGDITLDTLSDLNGRFVFDRLTFADPTKFIIQARTSTGIKDVDITMDKLPIQPLSTTKQIPDTQLSNSNLYNYQQNGKQFYEELQKYGINKHAVMLQEVSIKQKREVQIPHSANLNGPGNANQVITEKDLDNLGCSRLLDCLIAKLSGITFRGGYLYVNRLKGMRYPSTEQFPDPMMIYIDGTPMEQPVHIDEIRPDEIEGIEVLSGTNYSAIYGHQGAAGVIVITTKMARRINNYYREAPGVIVYNAKGFYKAREFYSPQYDNPKTNQKMADLRSTIYWQPNIITDKDGKATFSFFNADGKGTYRVIIEGIDTDGNLGRQVYRYKVE